MVIQLVRLHYFTAIGLEFQCYSISLVPMQAPPESGDQLYYFTTIGLQFQETCLLKLSPSLVPMEVPHCAVVKLFRRHAEGA